MTSPKCIHEFVYQTPQPATMVTWFICRLCGTERSTYPKRIETVYTEKELIDIDS